MPRKADPLVIRHAGLRPGKRAQSTAEKDQREDERTMRNRRSAAKSRRKKAAEEKRDRDKMEWQDKKIAELRDALSRKNDDMNRFHELTSYQFHHEFEDDQDIIRDLISTARYDDSRPLMDDMPDGRPPNPLMNPSMRPTPSSCGTIFSSQNSETSLRNAGTTFSLVGPPDDAFGSEQITVAEEDQPTHISPVQLDMTSLTYQMPTAPGSSAPVVDYSTTTEGTMPQTHPWHGPTTDRLEQVGAQFVLKTVFTYHDPMTITRPDENTSATTSFPSTESSTFTSDELNLNSDPLPSNQSSFSSMLDEYLRSMDGPMDGVEDAFKDFPLLP